MASKKRYQRDNVDDQGQKYFISPVYARGRMQSPTDPTMDVRRSNFYLKMLKDNLAQLQNFPHLNADQMESVARQTEQLLTQTVNSHAQPGYGHLASQQPGNYGMVLSRPPGQQTSYQKPPLPMPVSMPVHNSQQDPHPHPHHYHRGGSASTFSDLEIGTQNVTMDDEGSEEDFEEDDSPSAISKSDVPQRKERSQVVQKWAADEDELLRNAVEANRGKNWKKIAEYLPGRTDVQCLHRWQKVLRPGLVKGPWTAVEDKVLYRLVLEHGPSRWSEIAKMLNDEVGSGRLGKQCRERWFNHLDPSIRRGDWTEEEDRIIVERQDALGNRWSEISRLLIGRTENAVKNRWNSLMRKQFQKPVTEKPVAVDNGFVEHGVTQDRPRIMNDGPTNHSAQEPAAALRTAYTANNTSAQHAATHHGNALRPSTAGSVVRGGSPVGPNKWSDTVSKHRRMLIDLEIKSPRSAVIQDDIPHSNAPPPVPRGPVPSAPFREVPIYKQEQVSEPLQRSGQGVYHAPYNPPYIPPQESPSVFLRYRSPMLTESPIFPPKFANQLQLSSNPNLPYNVQTLDFMSPSDFLRLSPYLRASATGGAPGMPSTVLDKVLNGVQNPYNNDTRQPPTSGAPSNSANHLKLSSPAPSHREFYSFDINSLDGALSQYLPNHRRPNNYSDESDNAMLVMEELPTFESQDYDDMHMLSSDMRPIDDFLELLQ
eukprot:GILJ01002650.1.p1 GENE.GILJ01002650.1~~GILJ01002650.1.p1  ORF type:complete len:739 (-),score=90.19 GILJ01002650.1:331-2457(-)